VNVAVLMGREQHCRPLHAYLKLAAEELGWRDDGMVGVDLQGTVGTFQVQLYRRKIEMGCAVGQLQPTGDQRQQGAGR
jgi:hypothetical protein